MDSSQDVVLYLEEGFDDGGPGNSRGRRLLNLALERCRQLRGKLIVSGVVPGHAMPWVASFFPQDPVANTCRLLHGRLRRWGTQWVPRDVPWQVAVQVGGVAGSLGRIVQGSRVGLVVMAGSTAVPPAWDACPLLVLDEATGSVAEGI
ncbi:MAG: hypothetical protein ACFCBW_00440 [Candidatus Competibacterales bacterium]